MGHKKSKASVQSKDTTAPPRRINVQMVQNVLLIWLDGNIDENNSDCRNTITQLRRSMNNISIFTDGEECVQFLEDMQDEKSCMIISGTLGQQIVPRIHNLTQVDTIFIFCGNKQYHEEWAKNWPKIKGVFTEINPICEALKKTAKQCEQDAIPISIMATTGDISSKKLDQLEPSFMYTQIMKEILLTIKFEEQHIKEYIDHCRNAFAKNPAELDNINQFEQQYHDQIAIWWYTKECFLYRMLNLALRQLDVDIVVKMGFFIADLHRHITQLHQKQFGGDNSDNVFKVYRGQGMAKSQFEELQQTKGGLLSFDNFLSTSKKREVSMDFAKRGSINSDMVGILFVMIIDPTQSTTPFASINDVGAYGNNEDEVLFAMHTVFRIQDIQSMGGNGRLFRVKLTLTSDNDKDLHALTDRIREESFPECAGWYRLGEVLGKMSQFQKAQEVYEMLLEQATEEGGKSPIYHQLGLMKYEQGEYQEAIEFYEKSFAIEEKITPLRHTNLAMSYNNISSVYSSMGEYPKALSSLEKALAIQEQSLPSNHRDLANSYNNVGAVYDNMGEYPKALSYYEKALLIWQQSLPSNHPNLAGSYNNIGAVYDKMGEYPKALSSHEKALAIKQQSLPPNHPDLAASYNNIGNVYDHMGEYPKALYYNEKALAIQQQLLPSKHPDLARSYTSIGNVHDRMGEYPKAFSSHEKALAIWQQSLPSNHPNLAMCYNNIGNVYDSMGEYPKALSYYEKSLAIDQQSLSCNHPDLATSYNNIGLVYEKMGDYLKACTFFEKTVNIVRKSLPSTHPKLKMCKDSLDRAKKKL